MYKITIIGEASGKEVKTFIFNELPSSEISLMDYLIQENIPIASSCYGEGVCRKCATSHDLLTCQINLSDLFSQNNDVKLVFSYL
ncbi:MAG: 2Fe-2S iron-sulfur cluster binding domain-containing protein [Oligoflexia bacterium]|nr:2Fe-2S iron-sulfur cluster binding domain-containing protein [Oligoflexia bacterium]